MSCIYKYKGKDYTKEEFYSLVSNSNFIQQEQTHILGSKQDIEGFKKFVEQPINKEIKPVTFKTGKGSVYTYLPDGRVERFKTVEGKKYPAQDLIVFVKFKDSEQEQNFLEGVQDRERSGTKVYVIDKQGNKYSKNSDIKGKEVFLALVETKTNKVIDTVATKQEPTIGYNTYDESRYVENGEPMRSMHIGNKVTEISNQSTEIKPKIDSSKKIENLKRGDIINFQQQEFLVERVKNEGIDVRDVNTGDVDFISTEDYINETQEQPIIEETKEELPGLDNLPDPQCK